MENKINIAELLKDCPKGMELDCTIWDSEAKVFLKGILDEDFGYPIEVTVKYNNLEYSKSFTKYGAFNDLPYCKCVIFPKGKTTWEGFQRPFRDGDIVVTTLGNIAIIRKPIGEELFYIYGLMVGNGFYKDETVKVVVERPASEKEKQKLFQAIKDNGYKWNDETKILEKLVEPKFKVGDRVIRKATHEMHIIERITSTGYLFKNEGGVGFIFENENLYKLVPNKFDITTLKPFDKVLVRDKNRQEWCISLFSHCNGLEVYKHSCINGSGYAQCIPYNEDTKHLLGTTNDCDDYFKTWEK